MEKKHLSGGLVPGVEKGAQEEVRKGLWGLGAPALGPSTGTLGTTQPPTPSMGPLHPSTNNNHTGDSSHYDPIWSHSSRFFCLFRGVTPGTAHGSPRPGQRAEPLDPAAPNAAPHTAVPVP